jgi:nucleotide-binding universal stress UspA family protein
MNTGTHERAVVVGVDASEPAFRALRFAADEAVRRAAPLRIVHAVTLFDGLTYPYPELDVPGLMDAGAQSVLQAAKDLVAVSVPADRISTAAVDGNPVDVLVDASADASLVVIGGRGVGGMTGLLLGSTAQGVGGARNVPGRRPPARPLGAGVRPAVGRRRCPGSR